MKSFVFDQAGHCLYLVNAEVEHEGATVVLSDIEASPEEVWYDHEAGKMKFKSPMPIVVTTNKIENIPAGGIVIVGVDECVVDDGLFEIEVSAPQTVRATVYHVRHHTAEVEIPCEVQA
jgi:hypothetical protein